MGMKGTGRLLSGGKGDRTDSCVVRKGVACDGSRGVCARGLKKG